MNACSSLIALSLATFVFAQSPLSTLQPSYPPASVFIWPGPVSSNLYFNLAVNANTAVTIHGLDVQLDAAGSPAGIEGTVQLYVTVAGGSYAGFQASPFGWSLVASGPCISAGPAPSRVCFPTGVTLQAGTTYGVAVNYVGLRPLFLAGNSTGVPGGVGPGTNQYYINSELTLLAGSTISAAFTGTAFSPFVWLGAIHYGIGSTPTACASASAFGTGCYTTAGSFYQRFSSAAAAATALNGRAISLVPTASGYNVTGASGMVPFINPSATAQTLPANDNGETAVNLTTPWSYPGGATTQLHVNTNGYVSVAFGNVPTPNNFTPNVAGMLNAAGTAYWCWHDYNPTEAGSGGVRFEEVNANTMAVITWQDVESYPVVGPTGIPVANRSTFQMQFDYTTFRVNYVWQNLTAVGGSVFSDEHVIGFSTGGPSPDPGPTNIPALTSLSLTLPEAYPLTLAAAPRPLVGNTIALTTSNETGQSLGINFLSLVALQPGVNLGVIGMANCLANIDITAGFGNVINNFSGPSQMVVSLPIPTGQAALVGQVFHSQSIWIDPAANPFGATTSNGVTMRIGTF